MAEFLVCLSNKNYDKGLQLSFFILDLQCVIVSAYDDKELYKLMKKEQEAAGKFSYQQPLQCFDKNENFGHIRIETDKKHLLVSGLKLLILQKGAVVIMTFY